MEGLHAHGRDDLVQWLLQSWVRLGMKTRVCACNWVLDVVLPTC
jgi:hypothetical protein